MDTDSVAWCRGAEFSMGRRKYTPQFRAEAVALVLAFDLSAGDPEVQGAAVGGDDVFEDRPAGDEQVVAAAVG